MIRKISALLTALLLVTSLPLAALADTWNLDDGNITVSASETGQTVTQGETTKPDDSPTITQKDSTTATGNTITIKTEDNATANVTIENVNISTTKPGIDVGDSSLNLTVKGENKIKNTATGIQDGTGIHVSSGNLTITGDGQLEVDRAERGLSAAIGSKYSEDMSGTITITGSAQVTGNSISRGPGAGIGSGQNGNMSGTITIAGDAQVTGSSGSGAGIGSGQDGAVSESGSIIIADNATVNASASIGAGIGSGAALSQDENSNAMSGSIHITGTATVEASASSGAGIGSSSDGKMSGTITIDKDATVTAESKDGDFIGAGKGGKVTGTINLPKPEPTEPEPTEPKPTQPEPTEPEPTEPEPTEPEPTEPEFTQSEANGTAIYQVLSEDGVSVGYTSTVKDGVLTITVKGDYARLTGTVASLKLLASWGYKAITLVTDNATSTFDLADLMAQAPGTYALTHSGKEVTLTLNGEALTGILK